MCQVISKVLSNFHSLYFSYFKGRWACLPLISWNQTIFWSRFIPQGSSTSPFPTIPSHLFRFGFIPTGSGLLAFVFFWSFKFFLLQLFSPCVLGSGKIHCSLSYPFNCQHQLTTGVQWQVMDITVFFPCLVMAKLIIKLSAWPSLWSTFHICTWLLKKTRALTTKRSICLIQ